MALTPEQKQQVVLRMRRDPAFAEKVRSRFMDLAEFSNLPSGTPPSITPQPNDRLGRDNAYLYKRFQLAGPGIVRDTVVVPPPMANEMFPLTDKERATLRQEFSPSPQFPLTGSGYVPPMTAEQIGPYAVSKNVSGVPLIESVYPQTNGRKNRPRVLHKDTLPVSPALLKLAELNGVGDAKDTYTPYREPLEQPFIGPPTTSDRQREIERESQFKAAKSLVIGFNLDADVRKQLGLTEYGVHHDIKNRGIEEYLANSFSTGLTGLAFNPPELEELADKNGWWAAGQIAHLTGFIVGLAGTKGIPISKTMTIGQLGQKLAAKGLFGRAVGEGILGGSISTLHAANRMVHGEAASLPEEVLGIAETTLLFNVLGGAGGAAAKLPIKNRVLKLLTEKTIESTAFAAPNVGLRALHGQDPLDKRSLLFDLSLPWMMTVPHVATYYARMKSAEVPEQEARIRALQHGIADPVTEASLRRVLGFADDHAGWQLVRSTILGEPEIGKSVPIEVGRGTGGPRVRLGLRENDAVATTKEPEIPLEDRLRGAYEYKGEVVDVEPEVMPDGRIRLAMRNRKTGVVSKTKTWGRDALEGGILEDKGLKKIGDRQTSFRVPEKGGQRVAPKFNEESLTAARDIVAGLSGASKKYGRQVLAHLRGSAPEPDPIPLGVNTKRAATIENSIRKALGVEAAPARVAAKIPDGWEKMPIDFGKEGKGDAEDMARVLSENFEVRVFDTQDGYTLIRKTPKAEDGSLAAEIPVMTIEEFAEGKPVVDSDGIFVRYRGKVGGEDRFDVYDPAGKHRLSGGTISAKEVTDAGLRLPKIPTLEAKPTKPIEPAKETPKKEAVESDEGWSNIGVPEGVDKARMVKRLQDAEPDKEFRVNKSGIIQERPKSTAAETKKTAPAEPTLAAKKPAKEEPAKPSRVDYDALPVEEREAIDDLGEKHGVSGKEYWATLQQEVDKPAMPNVTKEEAIEAATRARRALTESDPVAAIAGMIHAWRTETSAAMEAKVLDWAGKRAWTPDVESRFATAIYESLDRVTDDARALGRAMIEFTEWISGYHKIAVEKKGRTSSEVFNSVVHRIRGDVTDVAKPKAPEAPKEGRTVFTDTNIPVPGTEVFVDRPSDTTYKTPWGKATVIGRELDGNGRLKVRFASGGEGGVSPRRMTLMSEYNPSQGERPAASVSDKEKRTAGVSRVQGLPGDSGGVGGHGGRTGLEELPGGVEEEAAEAAVSASAERQKTPRDIEPDLNIVPANVSGKLYDFQRVATAFNIMAQEKHGASLNFTGMGMGKTAEIIAAAEHWRKKGKIVIIVTPAGVIKPNWTTGAMGEGTSYRDLSELFEVPLALWNAKTVAQKGRAYVTTYENLEDLATLANKDMVVFFDESQYLKNVTKSLRAFHGMQIGEKAAVVGFYSGTPIDELYHIGAYWRALIREGETPDGMFGHMGLTPKEVEIKQPKTGKVIGYRRIWDIPTSANSAAYTRAQLKHRLDKLWKDGGLTEDLPRMDLLVQDPVYIDDIALKLEEQGNSVLADRVARLQAIQTEAFARAETRNDRMVALLATRRAQEEFKAEAIIENAMQDYTDGKSVIFFVESVNDGKVTAPLKPPEYEPVLKKDKKTGQMKSTGEQKRIKETIFEYEGGVKAIKRLLLARGIKDSDIVHIHGVPEEYDPAIHGSLEKDDAAVAKFMRDDARFAIVTGLSGGQGISLDDRTGAHPRVVYDLSPDWAISRQMQKMFRPVRVTTKSAVVYRNVWVDTPTDTRVSTLLNEKLANVIAVLGGETVDIDIAHRGVTTATARDIAAQKMKRGVAETHWGWYTDKDGNKSLYVRLVKSSDKARRALHKAGFNAINHPDYGPMWVAEAKDGAATQEATNAAQELAGETGKRIHIDERPKEAQDVQNQGEELQTRPEAKEAAPETGTSKKTAEVLEEHPAEKLFKDIDRDIGEGLRDLGFTDDEIRASAVLVGKVASEGAKVEAKVESGVSPKDPNQALKQDLFGKDFEPQKISDKKEPRERTQSTRLAEWEATVARLGARLRDRQRVADAFADKPEGVRAAEDVKTLTREITKLQTKIDAAKLDIFRQGQQPLFQEATPFGVPERRVRAEISYDRPITTEDGKSFIRALIRIAREAKSDPDRAAGALFEELVHLGQVVPTDGGRWRFRDDVFTADERAVLLREIGERDADGNLTGMLGREGVEELAKLTLSVMSEKPMYEPYRKRIESSPLLKRVVYKIADALRKMIQAFPELWRDPRFMNKDVREAIEAQLDRNAGEAIKYMESRSEAIAEKINAKKIEVSGRKIPEFYESKEAAVLAIAFTDGKSNHRVVHDSSTGLWRIVNDEINPPNKTASNPVPSASDQPSQNYRDWIAQGPDGLWRAQLTDDAPPAFWVPIDAISADPKRFQPRFEEFSEETVGRIVGNPNKNRFDSLLVFVDPTDGKLYTLRHSRFEAAKRLGMNRVPVRFFDPSDEASWSRQGEPKSAEEIVRLAQQAAKLDNDVMTTMSDAETFKVYMEFVDAGVPAESLRGRFESKNWKKFEAWGALSRDSKWWSFLNVDSRPVYFDQFSRWVGDLVAASPERLPRSRQDEIFDFIYDRESPRSISKDALEREIRARINMPGYDPTQPLNLKMEDFGDKVFDSIVERSSTLEAQRAELNRRYNDAKSDVMQVEFEISKGGHSEEVLADLQSKLAFFKQALDYRYAEYQGFKARLLAAHDREGQGSLLQQVVGGGPASPKKKKLLADFRETVGRNLAYLPARARRLSDETIGSAAAHFSRSKEGSRVMRIGMKHEDYTGKTINFYDKVIYDGVHGADKELYFAVMQKRTPYGVRGFIWRGWAASTGGFKGPDGKVLNDDVPNLAFLRENFTSMGTTLIEQVPGRFKKYISDYLAATRKVFDDSHRRFIKAGGKVWIRRTWKDDSKWDLIGEPGYIQDYHPRVLTDRSIEALFNRDPKDPVFQALELWWENEGRAQAKARGYSVEQPGIGVQKKLLSLSDFLRTMDSPLKIKRFGHLEYQRIINFPFFVDPKKYDMPGGRIQILEVDPFAGDRKYYTSAARRIATIRIFGQGHERFDALTESLRKVDPYAAADWEGVIAPTLIGSTIEREFRGPGRMWRAFTRTMAPMSHAARLTASAPQQFVGVLSVWQKFGTVPFAKALVMPIFSAQARGDLHDMRMFAGFLNDNIQSYSATEYMTGLSGKVARRLLRHSGFQSPNRFVDRVSMLAAKYSIEHGLSLMKSGDIGKFRKFFGVDPRTYVRRLQRDFGFTMNEILDMQANGIKEGVGEKTGYITRIARRAPALTNALNESVFDRPPWMHKEIAKVMVPFASYARIQGRMMAEALRDAKRGNAAPLTRMIVGGLIQGELITAAKNFLNLSDREDRDSVAATLFNDYIEAATLGMWGFAYNAALWATRRAGAMGTTTDVFQELVTPPTVSTPAEIAEGLLRMDPDYAARKTIAIYNPFSVWRDLIGESGVSGAVATALGRDVSPQTAAKLLIKRRLIYTSQDRLWEPKKGAEFRANKLLRMIPENARGHYLKAAKEQYGQRPSQ